MTLPIMGDAPSAVCSASFGKLRIKLRRDMQVMVKNTLGYSRIPRGDVKFDAGMFMACALLQTGPHTGPISRLTGISRRQCALWGVKARELKIFCREGVYADPWMNGSELDATIQFVLDVMELTGEIARDGQRGHADTTYRSATETA